MKTTLAIVPALAALCQAAALLQDADFVERDAVFVRQVTIIVTQTTTRNSAAPVYTTSTKYTTLPTKVVTKTSTITKPYSPPESTSTVVVTFTAKPTTYTPPVVTVTVTARTSTSAKPPVTVTVTYVPPFENSEPEYPEEPEETPNNPWVITRTAPILTFGRRAPSPAPEANPQRGQGRPTRGGGWAIPKRAPQSFGVPTRTVGGIIPSETYYPGDPEEEYPDYSEDEPTYVLGTPSRTLNVTPTPVKPVATSTKKAISTKKPWWYQEPVTVKITRYTPSPTGTLIRNTGTLPVLTLRDEGGALVERQDAGADADVTRSATFAEGAPVRSTGSFLTVTVPVK